MISILYLLYNLTYHAYTVQETFVGFGGFLPPSSVYCMIARVITELRKE